MARRDYQETAVNRTFDYLNASTGNGVIVMPTGTGKSHVIAGIVERALAVRPNARVQMLTTAQELIEQNLEKLQDAWPAAPVGVFSAGLNRKQDYLPVTFGGIKSMVNAVDRFGPVDLTIIDECHKVSPSDDTMFAQYHNELRKKNPYLRTIGLTATDWRMGMGKIAGPGNFFDDIIINMATTEGFNWFINQGYLVKLLPRPTETQYDLSKVRVSSGEYNQNEMQAVMDDDRKTYAALQETLHWGFNRRKWLVFAAGVKHAETTCAMLNSMGIPTTVVHKGIPKKERRQRILDYKAGKYRCIVNNNILTTGFDDPGIDLIVVLRPSKSSSLWVQMLGRGTRPVYAPGFDLSTVQGRLLAIANSYKQNCLVLDFVKNTQDLGPINDPRIPKAPMGNGGDMPIKICETKRLKKGYTGCGFYNHPSVRQCDNCDAEFNFSIYIANEASNQALISDGSDRDFQWFNVQNTFYSEQVGASGKPYLRVDYYINAKKKFSDYIHLEQEKWLLHQAKEWWKARATHPPEWGVPPTVKAALPYCKQYLKQPTKIRVWVNKSPIPEVVNYEYE
jgi:DNA repair protein RadD